MKDKKVIFITQSAVIAALYVVLTVIGAPLSFGIVQVRISEMLCVLPVFFTSAVPGLFVGCLISNIIAGANVLDIIFGSAATLIGAIFTFLLRNICKKKHLGFVAAVPPIIANTVVIPLVLGYAYNMIGTDIGKTVATLPLIALFVFCGEVISCGVLGTVLLLVMKKRIK
ncbi:MAG: QueT transporter family protein [Clostridiales bacterium]|nr:QueT transporter family protein [Clostridiales bacterium]